MKKDHNYFVKQFEKLAMEYSKCFGRKLLQVRIGVTFQALKHDNDDWKTKLFSQLVLADKTEIYEDDKLLSSHPYHGLFTGMNPELRTNPGKCGAAAADHLMKVFGLKRATPSQMKKLNKACDEVRERVSKLSPKEKEKLDKHARKTISEGKDLHKEILKACEKTRKQWNKLSQGEKNKLIGEGFEILSKKNRS